MKLLLYAIVFCSSILFVGCNTVNVDYQYDPGADMAGLESYNWFPVPRENIRHDLFIKQAKGELKNQLHARGYRVVDGDPDFFIALHGGFQSRMDYKDWEYLYEYYRPYWAKRKIDITKYEDQQLIVDFIDADSKELIYRATATAFIIEADQEEREEAINDAVLKILENFPPTAVSEK